MIKKVLIIAGLFLSMLPVQAQIEYTCPSEPYPVANKVSCFFNTVTGANFVSRNAVKKVIQYNLKKTTGSDFDVDLKIFNATDLMAGKFKSLSVSAKEANFSGFSVHDISAKTKCEYNRIGFQKNEAPKIYEDFLLDFSAKITNDDLQNLIKKSEFQKYVSNLNLAIGNLNMLKISTPELKIANNRLKYSFRATAPLLFTQISHEFICDTGLKITDGKLTFSDVKVNNVDGWPSDMFNKLVNTINPFKINLSKTLGFNSYFDLQNVNIKNNELLVSGTFIAPKNTD